MRTPWFRCRSTPGDACAEDSTRRTSWRDGWIYRQCERSGATAPQTGLSAAARRRNVRHAFTLSPFLRRGRRRRLLEGRIVILIDDVRTTGATLDACAATLKTAGALEVGYSPWRWQRTRPRRSHGPPRQHVRAALPARSRERPHLNDQSFLSTAANTSAATTSRGRSASIRTQPLAAWRR